MLDVNNYLKMIYLRLSKGKVEGGNEAQRGRFNQRYIYKGTETHETAD